jgi:hypothetical protein
MYFKLMKCELFTDRRVKSDLTFSGKIKFFKEINTYAEVTYRRNLRFDSSVHISYQPLLIKIILLNFVLAILSEIYWIALILVRIYFTIIPALNRTKRTLQIFLNYKIVMSVKLPRSACFI